MRILSFYLYLCCWLEVLLGLLSACHPIEVPENQLEQPSSKKYTLGINLKTQQQDTLAVPTYLWVFDKVGKVIAFHRLAPNENEATLQLPSGLYQVSAIRGLNEQFLPNTITSLHNSNFVLSPPYDQPITYGINELRINNRSKKQTITLRPITTETRFVLRNIPPHAQDLSLLVENSYTQCNLAQQYSHSTSIKIPLFPKGQGIWESPKHYFFPTDGDSLALSIMLYHGQTHEKHSSKYNKEWMPTITWSYPAPTLPPPASSPDSLPHYQVERFPQVRSLWRGFCLLYYEKQSPTEREAVLLSLHEWRNVASAFSKNKGQEASELAAAYQEQGINQWHIPTREEAEVLSDYFGDELELAELEELLRSVGSPPLLLENATGGKVAYLCDKGQQAFRFNGRKPSKAKANTTYQLRLLKRIKLVQKQ